MDKKGREIPLSVMRILGIRLLLPWKKRISKWLFTFDETASAFIFVDFTSLLSLPFLGLGKERRYFFLFLSSHLITGGLALFLVSFGGPISGVMDKYELLFGGGER